MPPYIFIQIAAYRDPELLPTMRSALFQANRPEALRFGVCFQERADSADYGELLCFPGCRVIQVEPEQSGGTCWARAMTQSLWQGEEYALQIDSHARFESGWDDLALDMLRSCGEKAVLTAYCPPYEPGKPLQTNPPAYTLGADEFSHYGALLLRARVPLGEMERPVRGAFWSGHFSFSKATLIQDVPYDPNLYFHGEEISIAVRAWTHGYNLFYPHRAICRHQYGRQGRHVNWEENTTWYGRDVLSQQRVRRLLKMEAGDEAFKQYGLGNERTLAEYEAFSGVRFADRQVSACAWSGWYSEQVPRLGKRTQSPAQDIMFVTAFWNAGRDKWTHFSRSRNLYMEWFSMLAALKNVQLVCYCPEELWDELPPGNYFLRPFERNDTFFRAYYEKEQAIMQSEEFRKFVGPRRSNPEHCHPDYSLMTHAKANFVRRVSRQFPGHSHYAWIDFGIVRYPMEADTVFDWGPLMDDRIHMQLFSPPETFSTDPRKLCLESPDALSASLFVVPATLTMWYENVYEQELRRNHAAGIADDEQNIMLRLAQKYPDKVCADMVDGWYDFFYKSF